MTSDSDLEQSPSTPALTRRELRERERAADAVAASVAPVAPATPVAPTATPARGTVFVPSGPGPQVSPFPYATPAPNSSRAGGSTPIATKRSTAIAPKRIARTAGSRLLSVGALVLAGALAFGMSVPANAFYTPSTAIAAEDSVSQPKALQTVEVAANVEAAPTARDKWSVLSWAEVLRQRYGSRDFNYKVGSGPIRWPFPYAVPISSGFGERVAPCRGCSVHHMGLDLNPGNSAAIFAIADGVVVEHLDLQYGYGNHVIIRHEIDGQTVETLYAHMQSGSSPVNVGDVLKVGDFIGLVGETGMATGPHLHLEISIEGEKIDPFTWLKAKAS